MMTKTRIAIAVALVLGSLSAARAEDPEADTNIGRSGIVQFVPDANERAPLQVQAKRHQVDHQR